ncbi:unnamed protein product [Cylicocyclus nassatus]|uniref:Uncharacterized protein n=1 Tax=Cylicocyclus nassatus TaxID=53992 RepID=A0AA36H7P9_CYLNA|nr:unnamed protein product [Cylicocyclus nassatus]
MNEEVVDVSLAMRQVSYYEPVNLWIGPRFADLIRLGAKYSPCMRRESGLWRLINEERAKENGNGCCVFNDGTGCYQTGQSSCPSFFMDISIHSLHSAPRMNSLCGLRLILTKTRS